MIMFQGMIFSSPPVGEDFTSVARNITFAPNQTVTCGSIPIVDDNTQEVPEAFMVRAVHTCRDANYIASKCARCAVKMHEVVIESVRLATIILKSADSSSFQ